MNLTDYIRAKGGTAYPRCQVLTKLAEEVGCSPDTLYMITRQHKRPSAKLAVALEDATKGKVKREELRNDLFAKRSKRGANEQRA